MSNRLTRKQLAALGLVVLAILALGGVGLGVLAAKDRLWADTFELVVALPDAADVPPGTPVRLRGVEAGHVIAVNYPDDDDTPAMVHLKLCLDGKYRGRLFNDATAKVQAVGLLGSKVIALQPGTAKRGVLNDNFITASPSADLTAAADRITKVADEAELLLKEVRTGKGTLAKLVNDDSLFKELTALAGDARSATGKIEQEASNVKGLVADGRETLKSVKQGTDAIQKLPIVRGYVENATGLLVRPDCRKQQYDYNAADLFEPHTAILSPAGRTHLANLAELIKAAVKEPAQAKLDIVVAALADPADAALAGGAAAEVTKKQAEVIAEALKELKVHKTGMWHRNRPVTPIGLGTGPSPIADAAPLPAARVQVLLFWPS